MAGPVTLQGRLATVRRQARRAVWQLGVAQIVIVVVATLVLVGLCDWLLHFDDPGLRLLLALSLAGGAGWLAHVRLVRPLAQGWDDVELARRVERRYPVFHESLASAVSFEAALRHPQIGSPKLQEHVIRTATARLAPLRMEDVIDRRMLRPWTAAAAGTCVVAMLLILVSPTAAALAVRRLVVPFGAPSWPKATHLVLRTEGLDSAPLTPETPLRLARGDTLRLYVENDRGRLPRRLALERRLPKGEVQSETLRPTTIRDGEGRAREVAAIQIVATNGPLDFRAVGGDDDTMSWHRLEVVPPPVLETLQVVLVPPAYTRRPPQRLPANVGHVQGLVGTHVQITGQAQQRLSKAELRMKDQRLPVTLASDQRSIRAEFEIQNAGVSSYWFELADEGGFENGEPPRYEIHGIADHPPDVSLEAPAVDLRVTPAAEVHIAATARDDLGLREVRLAFQSLGTDEARTNGTISLFNDGGNLAVSVVPASGESVTPATVAGAGTVRPPGNQTGSTSPTSRSVSYTWALASMGLVPGQRLELCCEATDHYNLGPEHVGRSPTRTLLVIDAEQKRQELTNRQSELLEHLERGLKLQEQARDQVRDLKHQLQQRGGFRPSDRDALQRAELGQHQVAAQLASPGDSLQWRTRDMLAELHGNRLEDPELERRLNLLSDGLKRIAQGPLPHAEQLLTRTRKLTQAESASQAPGTKKPSRRPTTGGKVPAADPPSTKSSTDARPDSKSAEGRAKGASPGGAESPGRSNSRNGAASDPPRDGNGKRSNKSAQAEPKSAPEGGDRRQREGRNPSESDRTSEAEPPGSSRDRGSDSASGRPSDRAEGRESPLMTLEAAEQQQSDVVESLQELRRELWDWRQQRDASQELRDLTVAQDDLARQTAEIAKRVGHKRPEELLPGENAELNRLAAKQRSAADALSQFEQPSSKDNAESSTERNMAADDAREFLRQAAASGRMREAAAEIAGNNTGSAGQLQRQVRDDLRQATELLQNRRPGDAESLVKRLKQTEQSLKQLREAQEELLKDTRAAPSGHAANGSGEALADLQRRQARLQQDVRRLARQLERLQSRPAGAAAERSAEHLERVDQSLRAGDSETAAEGQAQAAAELDRAQHELARHRREAEEHLADEQLTRLAQDVKDLLGRERALIAETRRLEQIRSARAQWTRAQLKSLRDLVDAQRDVEGKVNGLAQSVTAAEAFALALRSAAGRMHAAAELLAGRDTGAPTQTVQEAACRSLTHVLEALEEGQFTPAPDGPESTTGRPRAGGVRESIPALAQLKLLYRLQQDLNERTLECGRLLPPGGPPGPELRGELRNLAREQGDLARLARSLTTMARGDDETPSSTDSSPPSTEPDARDAIGENGDAEPSPAADRPNTPTVQEP